MSESPTDPLGRMAGEQQLFAQSLRTLLRGPAVVCSAERSVAEAAELMRARLVGSVVIVDGQERAVGILTTHDLVGVLADGHGGAPVGQHMSRDPIALPSHAFAYEAAMAMTSNGIRHIVVTENERLIGIVSERDLFALQRLGLAELSMEIRSAASIDLLARVGADIRKLGALLVQQGVAPEPLTQFISVLNDRLSQRAIEIVRKRHDLDRISWCWIAFGSEGRFEQTFSTDQDNGIVFVTHGTGAPAQDRQRLLPFAREVNEALDACGFPLCKGAVMASNPQLCLTLEEWQARMAGWIAVSSPKALLDAAICFDFRPVHGDASLAAALRDWTLPRMRGNPAFLRHLAQASLDARPALGRFGRFATDNVPGAPHSIDLKLHGTRIFVDAARVYALAHGLGATNTAERLRAVRAARRARDAETAGAIDAFHFVHSLRLRIQAGAAGAASGNRIDPDALNAFDQASLKEAMRLARELQAKLALDYQL